MSILWWHVPILWWHVPILWWYVPILWWYTYDTCWLYLVDIQTLTFSVFRAPSPHWVFTTVAFFSYSNTEMSCDRHWCATTTVYLQVDNRRMVHYKLVVMDYYSWNMDLIASHLVHQYRNILTTIKWHNASIINIWFNTYIWLQAVDQIL